ncbi:MAG: hypothetical protein DMG11_19195 [Acidobacteria bacterium]|nr:MAG: hypothetical protein DMG11_19195 [Acidobacteriota bacterium]
MASSFPDPAVKILAIRFARLGDVILLLPALRSLKAAFPDARLTFLTGHRCAPLANLCPQIDEVIAVDRVAMRDGPVWRALRKMAGLVREIRGNRFDIVVDFHSFRETNLLTWVSGAPVRVGMKRYNAPYLSFCFNRPPVVEDKSLHVAEMFHRVVKSVVNEPSPDTAKLVIPDDLRTWAGQNLPAGPKIALYADAPVGDRVWPPERFASVADFAVERLGATVLVFSGEEGSGLAERVRKASRIPARMLTFTSVTIPELAALIASTQLLVSNDTGPMHLGPALGVPTLGLFSVGHPEHFRPTGPADRFLRANPIDGISVAAVIEAVDQMWAIADPGLQR